MAVELSAGVVLLLLTAGAVAGLISSIAGFASVVSYPVLIRLGLSPVVANTTSAVALVSLTAGAMLGSREELAGRGRALLPICLLAALGGGVGAVVLLTTPSTMFAQIVPWCIVLGSICLIAQPGIRRKVVNQSGARAIRWVAIGVLTVYAGYFGAGAGVLMLGVLGATGVDTLAVSNAAKNAVVGVANATAAIGFLLVGTVDLAAAIVMSVGALVGGALGPVVVRRAPDDLIRLGTAASGLLVAGYLLIAGS